MWNKFAGAEAQLMSAGVPLGKVAKAQALPNPWLVWWEIQISERTRTGPSRIEQIGNP